MFTVNTLIHALSNTLKYGNIPENLPVKHLEFFTPSKLTDIMDSKDHIFLNFDSEDSYDKGLSIKELFENLHFAAAEGQLEAVRNINTLLKKFINRSKEG